jgi:hypothetical protein
MLTAKYTDEQKIASQRYSSIKSRVGYDLKKYWTRDDFIAWYTEQESKCFYCGTSLEELIKFYNSTSSKRNRGKSLEVERIEDNHYSRDNCKLCCYWCNNSKSDVFSLEEFQNIGKAIGAAIKEKNSSNKITNRMKNTSAI